jgi:4'-phosphopantetheinyl transferase
VDAEHLRLDNVPLDIADRYFSTVELAEFRALPREARAEKFFYYWTLKEAYIKAIGKGLSVPLDQFSFSLYYPGRIDLSFHEGSSENPLNWRCWLIKPADTHVVAVCAVRNSLNPERLVVRKVVPLAFEAPLEYELLARSPD